MYKIMSEGGDIAIVEQPVYIRKHDNSCYVQTERDTAQGIAVNGEPYNLLGAELLDEALPTVWMVEVNGGEYLLAAQQQQVALATLTLASMGLAVDDTAQADAGVTLLKAAGVAPASDAEAPWKAGEYVEIGAVRTVDTTRYTCICAHLTGEHWHPTKAVGHVWEVTVSEEGTLEQPIPFVLGMPVKLGLHYSYGGKVYKWIAADHPSCSWAPGSAGTGAVWEKV